LILDWLPFAIFIGLLVFFMLRMRPQREQWMNHQRAQLAETQKTNQMLERIASALEKRGG
jgi:ATP-dependent Zn protease